MARIPNMKFSISATTRPQRPGEIDGNHYHFVDKPSFDKLIQDDEMLEYAEVFGNYYGTPTSPVIESLDRGEDVIFDVDWQGAQQISASKLSPYVVSVFILPPSIHELYNRLQLRGQDSDEVIRSRMLKARDEISHWAEYDYLIVNSDINRSASELVSIIQAERMKRERWDDASKFVQKLNQEFMELRHDSSL